MMDCEWSYLPILARGALAMSLGLTVDSELKGAGTSSFSGTTASPV